MPNCEPLSNSTKITGQLLPKELRMLAYFGNCQIANGTLTLNTQEDPDLILLAGHISNSTSDMIEVNMTNNNVLESVTVSQKQQQIQQIQHIQQQSFANITTFKSYQQKYFQYC